jgi:hypothetical protein
MSEIEGKVARVAASEQGRERVSNSCRWNFAGKGNACVSRDNLNRSMENAGVERRQFHAMLFGQFGQIQIGKFSAGLRGDSLQICGSARNGNVSPLLIRKKPSSLIGQVAVCFPRNQPSTLGWS